jgi:hypothetical protein
MESVNTCKMSLSGDSLCDMTGYKALLFIGKGKPA